LPVGQAVHGHAQAFFTILGHRVVEADALDETAITALARVSDDDVVEGALLGAATSQTNHDHFVVP
jgi:hypothetical protein